MRGSEAETVLEELRESWLQASRGEGRKEGEELVDWELEEF